MIQYTSNKKVAEHICKYMKTKFVRFLMLMAMSGFGLSKNVLLFVPIQKFDDDSDIDWTKNISEIDELLYKKYNFDPKDINFIENNVKEME